jgi:hypothetical protein
MGRDRGGLFTVLQKGDWCLEMRQSLFCGVYDLDGHTAGVFHAAVNFEVVVSFAQALH